LNRKIECEQHLTTKEVTILNDKLQKDQGRLRNQYAVDDVAFNNKMERGTYARSRLNDFLTENGIPIAEHIVNPDLGAELLER
jgi:hypothetical protein